MATSTFSVNINAPANKVWFTLWNDHSYRQWTSAFHEGSYAVSNWNEGDPIQFLSPEGSGMYSRIAEKIENEKMVFEHIGEVKNFEEQPLNDQTREWSGGKESYTLSETDGKTLLEVSVDIPENFKEYFETAFPKALAKVKELAENFMITIEADINAPVEKVWKSWTKPEHITKWNNASPDWHTPRAENDLRVGGSFLSRMEAKDGSFGFDFGGTYTEVKQNERIAYTMDDGRKVAVDFKPDGKTVHISSNFEAENMNSYEMQLGGWQAILNNFKSYTEGLS